MTDYTAQRKKTEGALWLSFDAARRDSATKQPQEDCEQSYRWVSKIRSNERGFGHSRRCVSREHLSGEEPDSLQDGDGEGMVEPVWGDAFIRLAPPMRGVATTRSSIFFSPWL